VKKHPTLLIRSRLRRFRRRLSGLRGVMLTLADTIALPLLCLGNGKRGAGRPVTGKPSVAVFNLHGAGDLLLSLPCLVQIRSRYPAGQYSLVLYCGPSAVELAAAYAPADDIVIVDRRRLLRSLSYRWSQLRTVSARSHRIAIQPTFNRMFAVEDALVRATGAAERVGSAGSADFISAARRWSNRWYSRLVEPSPRAMHELDRYGEFLRLLGWPAAPPSLPSLAVPRGSPAIAGSYVLFVPDSSSPLKSWPRERFEALAHQLADLSADEMFVFAGAPGGDRPGRYFRRWRKDRFVDRSEQTSVMEFLRLIEGARLVITNDSAGMHLAVMLHRPVVAIAGGGLPERYHPYPAWTGAQLKIVERRMPCFGCNWNCIHDIEKDQPAPCISGIETAEVLQAARAELTHTSNSGALANLIRDSGGQAAG
jgi:ADP-heptose:LPS heptosyltransferase